LKPKSLAKSAENLNTHQIRWKPISCGISNEIRKKFCRKNV